MKHANFPF